MKRIELLLLIYVVALLACSCSYKESVAKVKNDECNGYIQNVNEKIQLVDTFRKNDINCYDSIIKIVRTSAFVCALSTDYKVTIDDDDGSIIIIMITVLSANSIAMPAAWLKLDINNEILYDITIDPDNPEELLFNHLILNNIKNRCFTGK